MNNNLLDIYGVDASGMKGTPADVFFPETIEEAQEIIKKNSRIVPRGGATGLAGGAVPQNKVDVILDMSKLDKISNLNEEHHLVEIEAGVILDDLQEYLMEYGLEFPVKPSSYMACTVGGMIATDAVGNRAIKYGKTSHWVKWIEIIDCNGKLLRKGMTELSDYAGMEGITGVIAKACLKLTPLKTRSAGLIKVENLENIPATIHELKRNRDVSMIEFLDKGISERLGLEMAYHFIVEYENDSGKFKGRDYKKLLAKRDSVYPMIASDGFTRIEDPKIMIDKFPKLMGWLEEHKIPTFGHVGVGIIHPCFNHDQERLVPEMMKIVKRLGGSITGEHGVGILKKAFVEFNDKKILENLKKRTDTLGKFNIGKVI